MRERQWFTCSMSLASLSELYMHKALGPTILLDVCVKKPSPLHEEKLVHKIWTFHTLVFVTKCVYMLTQNWKNDPHGIKKATLT